jgi:hypothetical protein
MLTRSFALEARSFRSARLAVSMGLAVGTVGCGHPPAPRVAETSTPSVLGSGPLAPVTVIGPEESEPTDELRAASGLRRFFLHDECTAPFPPQPDTCAHLRLHEKSFTFGGKPGVVYDVTLHVRGIFEPTVIKGGETPDPRHPAFKVGGTVDTIDWSHWHIEVSNPKQTYWLNHHPWVSHTIYGDDYQATLPIAAGATVVVRVIDGNDRQIDNLKWGPDRQRVIEGVTARPLPGQMLSLEVVRVKAR